jgi:hypothetical protein
MELSSFQNSFIKETVLYGLFLLRHWVQRFAGKTGLTISELPTLFRLFLAVTQRRRRAAEYYFSASEAP